MITLDPDFQCYDIVSFISAGSHRFTLMSGKLTRPTATLPSALQVKHLFVYLKLRQRCRGDVASGYPPTAFGAFEYVASIVRHD
jgi:hypothetical protein